MAIELRHVPTWPSEVVGRYVTGGAANQDGYASATMNALAAELGTATPARLPGLYQSIDALAWKDFVDLPLVQLPILVAADSKLLNLKVGPFFSHIAWDEQDWGFLAS
jgi:hypothetical protein